MVLLKIMLDDNEKRKISSPLSKMGLMRGNQEVTETIIYKRRGLYEKSCLPDNSVDKTFLRGLQTNVNVKTYFMWDAVVNATVITQELSSVCNCITAFIYLDEQLFPPASLFALSTFIVLCFYLTFKTEYSLHQWIRDGKKAFVFLSFLLGLSPILKTLTDTVSTDSIYFMAGVLLVIHLISHDYGLSTQIVKPALSLTAAIAASVILASRLSTSFYVFEFLVFAVELFALYPILRRKLQEKKPWCRIPLTLFLMFLALLGIGTASLIYATLLLSVIMFVNVVCPIIFVHWQKYKNNMYGPWDEAIISD